MYIYIAIVAANDIDMMFCDFPFFRESPFFTSFAGLLRGLDYFRSTGGVLVGQRDPLGFPRLGFPVLHVPP